MVGYGTDGQRDQVGEEAVEGAGLVVLVEDGQVLLLGCGQLVEGHVDAAVLRQSGHGDDAIDPSHLFFPHPPNSTDSVMKKGRD